MTVRGISARPLRCFWPSPAWSCSSVSSVIHEKSGQMHESCMTLIAWSALLLLKMILLARIEHYGFILAMPAPCCWC
jgi:hypothetical protein